MGCGLAWFSLSCLTDLIPCGVSLGFACVKAADCTVSSDDHCRGCLRPQFDLWEGPGGGFGCDAGEIRSGYSYCPNILLILIL